MHMSISDVFRPRIAAKLRRLYGGRAESVLRRIDDLATRYSFLRDGVDKRLYDEHSVVLITYADQLRQKGRPSLQVLNGMLHESGMDKLLSAVHLLPCFPFSSDDGFSVIDYNRIDTPLGDWDDIDSLAKSFGLILDYVVNHCSQQHAWFQAYLRGEAPYTDYFIEADPTEDLSAVTRPRNLPLLTPFETSRGTRHVWTTFSADQIDLNFANPDVLLEMLDVLLLYVAHGSRAIRLDAIGFLWKTIGTTCMHLPETHLVVKLMRDLLDDLAPGTVVLTETNVPHEENISYFGEGDEAHAVYQFSLAPLLMDAFGTADAGPLMSWLSELEYPGPGMVYFNFTASHDGIGVRPLEGLVPPARVEALAEGVRARGGLVSTRQRPDGSESPYELNITYFSAMNTPEGLPPALHVRRFLTSQGVMLAMRGIPGIYFHSLVGTPNYNEGVSTTKQNRTINRRKFDIDEIRDILSKEDSTQGKVLEGYRRLLAVRTQQPAFHPDAPQDVIGADHAPLISFVRTSLDGKQRIVVLANTSEKPLQVDLAVFDGAALQSEMLTDTPIRGNTYEIEPYGLAWLAS
jgi:glycosidase